MKWLTTLILILTLQQNVYGQKAIIDCIQEALKAKPSPIVGLNNRYSLVSGEPIKINGIQAGMAFDNVLKINLGYNWMPLSQTEVKIQKSGNQQDTLLRMHKLSYISVSGEYIFYHTTKWKFGVPVLLGVGTHRITTTHSLQGKTETNNQFILPLEFGMNGLYYFTDWFGLKGGLGNRLTFGKSFSKTSGPYYSLGFTLMVEPIYQKVKKWVDD